MKKYNVERSTFYFGGIYLRRLYKLIIIILLSIILAYFIYFFNKEEKLRIVSLGDGTSSGETYYNIDGISYNDYLKEYLDGKNNLKSYNTSFVKKNYKIEELLTDLNNNVIDKKTDLTIKQDIHKANLVIINMGEEELVKMSMTNDLTKEEIEEFLEYYQTLIQEIKKISEAKIVVIGFYENKYLSKSNAIILNSEVSNMALKYDLTFINIIDLMLNKKFFASENSFYYNYLGHKELAEVIIHSI